MTWLGKVARWGPLAILLFVSFDCIRIWIFYHTHLYVCCVTWLCETVESVKDEQILHRVVKIGHCSIFRRFDIPKVQYSENLSYKPRLWCTWICCCQKHGNHFCNYNLFYTYSDIYNYFLHFHTLGNMIDILYNMFVFQQLSLRSMTGPLATDVDFIDGPGLGVGYVV